MSNLRRGLNPKPPPKIRRPDPNAIPEEDGDSSSTSSVSSTGTIVPSASARAAPKQTTPWHKYFEQELFLTVGSSTFHVYVTAPRDLEKDPLFVCHHGAGSGGLSFGLFALEMKRKPNAGILSINARDHGSFVESTGLGNDLSLAALSADLVAMIDATRIKLDWKILPSLVLVGHSLGGAVVADVASRDNFGGKLIGCVVIDVVEGSAIEALKSMQAYLASRPSSFPTLEDAVDWHVRSRTIRNHDSASISTPPLLVQGPSGQYHWRTDLSATRDYWTDWFTGLSAKFLSAKAAKLLILAGTDRLDKELMIGQMQGRFQLQVFPEAGHFVQEDIPDRVADVILEFYRRNDRSTLVLPPKVSDLLAQGKKV